MSDAIVNGKRGYGGVYAATPGTSTDNAVARWDGVDGSKLKDSPNFLVTDAGDITLAESVVMRWSAGAVGVMVRNTQETNYMNLWALNLVAYGSLSCTLIANLGTGGNTTRCWGDIQLDADLNHDGTKVGLYGTAPVVQSAAYTRNAAIVEDRTLLASANATPTNNNNVLAALIKDLQSRGFIG